MSDRTLRVLLVTETVLPQVGGGETQAALLAEGLAERGHQVTLLGRRSIPGTPRDETTAYRTLRVGPEGPGRWKKWGLLLTLPRVLPALLRRTDIVVVSGFRLVGGSVLRAAQRVGVPVVLKADSPGEWSGEYFRQGLQSIGLKLTHSLVRRALQRRNRQLLQARAFVSISEMLRQELQEGGVPSERVVGIPNGVDLERFSPAEPLERERLRKTLGLPPGPVLVNVGRIVRYKGIHALIQAWAKVSPLHPGATLVLVGGGSHDLDNCVTEIRALVDDLDLGSTVRFAGEVADSVPWLKASDGFVFASTHEAFGLVLVEAMGCGLPVVTTHVGVAPGCLQDGHNAWVVTPNDVEGLARAMDQLLSDLPAAARLGERARQVAINGFGSDVVVGQWERLLMSLVGEQIH